MPILREVKFENYIIHVVDNISFHTAKRMVVVKDLRLSVIADYDGDSWCGVCPEDIKESAIDVWKEEESKC